MPAGQVGGGVPVSGDTVETVELRKSSSKGPPTETSPGSFKTLISAQFGQVSRVIDTSKLEIVFNVLEVLAVRVS